MIKVIDRIRGGAVGAGLLGVLFAMTALLAAAESDRSSEPSTAALPPTTSFSLTTTTFTASPTTTATVVPTTTIATSRRCRAGDLHLVSGIEFGPLMQQSGAYFGLKSAARTACRVQGYPAVQFLDRAGHQMSAQWKGGAYIVQDPGATAMTLAPQATGWFALNWVVIGRYGGYEGCIDPAAIGVIPPGGSSQLRLPVHLRTGICPDSLGVTALGPWESFRHGATGPPVLGRLDECDDVLTIAGEEDGGIVDAMI